MSNEKILVVDDDKNICELLRLYLVKEGYGVTIANDGTAALQEFDKLHPDLVLLDVMMPAVECRSWLQCCRRYLRRSQRFQGRIQNRSRAGNCAGYRLRGINCRKRTQMFG